MAAICFHTCFKPISGLKMLIVISVCVTDHYLQKHLNNWLIMNTFLILVDIGSVDCPVPTVNGGYHRPRDVI